VLVEYGDYQCPQCGELYIQLRQFNDSRGDPCLGEILYALYPAFSSTSNLPPQAQKAAAATEAVGAQGQFLADVLIGASTRVRNGYLAEYADRLGLNVPQFLRDIAEERISIALTRY